MSSETGWRRDLTLDANGSSFFFAPHKGEYWIYNNSSSDVQLNQSGRGKTTVSVPGGTIFKIYCEYQEQIGISGGTAGNVVTITDSLDLKVIPQTKGLVKFAIVDSTGSVTALVTTSSTPPGNAAGLVTRIVGNVAVMGVAGGLVQTNIAQVFGSTTAPLPIRRQATASSGSISMTNYTVTDILTNLGSCGDGGVIVYRNNDTLNSVYISNQNTLTAGAGFILPPGSELRIDPVVTVNHTGLISFYAICSAGQFAVLSEVISA